MAGKRVKCPKCKKVLGLPADFTEGKIRSPACRGVFRVRKSKHKVSLDETVADWLMDDSSPAPPGESAPAERKPPAAAVPAERAVAAPGRSRPAACPRLVAVDRSGALFEFPVDFLRSPEFRCAIPRACIHCTARTHLTAHVVIFTPQLRDSISLEAEHAAGQLSLPQEKIGNARGTAVLELLPEVPNVPPPGNLPMPYWVCDMCRGAGWISGQIQVNTDTGRGFCRLRMRNLKMALGFFSNVGGEGCADYEKLKEFVEHTEQDPWDALPTVVRHRVEQWFRPNTKAGEQFLAYIPDRAFVRTEDGMNGLVISNHRLVYHHPPRHQECPRDRELTIQVRIAEGKEIVSIEAAGFKKRSVTLDRGGMMLFRRALSKGGFRAKWR